MSYIRKRMNGNSGGIGIGAIEIFAVVSFITVILVGSAGVWSHLEIAQEENINQSLACLK